MRTIITLLLITTSCTTTKNLTSKIRLDDCSGGLYKVIQFNSILRSTNYNEELFNNLIDTTSFKANVLLLGNIKAKDLYYELNKYNSKKFKAVIDYSELNYNCNLKNDTLIVTFNTQRVKVDSDELFYFYEYKLTKLADDLRIVSYREGLSD